MKTERERGLSRIDYSASVRSFEGPLQMTVVPVNTFLMRHYPVRFDGADYAQGTTAEEVDLLAKAV